MPKVNFYLDKHEPKDQDTAIFLTFHYQRGNGEKVKIKVAMRDTIHPQYWDINRHRPKRTNKHKFGSDITTRLNDVESFVLETFKTNRDIPKDEFVKKIKVAIGKTKEIAAQQKNDNLLDFLQKFIVERESNPEFGHSIVRCYRNLETRLKQFSDENKTKLKFNDIADEFATNFKNFLFSKDLQPSTVKRFFKDLKTVMNNAFERGEHSNTAYKRKSFIVKNDMPTSSIFLTLKQLQKIESLNLLDNPPLTIARDWFLIGCYTGLRVSDYQRLNKTHIRTIESSTGVSFQVIDILTQKTKKQVMIPINTPLSNILQRYNNDFPSERYRDQTLNQQIKEIGKLASLNDAVPITTMRGGTKQEKTTQLYEKLTTHVGRRTFINNLRLQGAPDNQINKATGHTSKDMINTYDRITLEQNAEKLRQYDYLR